MSRRSLRISFFLVGLGAGNKDMNLNMVFSFQLAGRVRTYSVPPFDFSGLFCFGKLKQRLGPATARSTAMRIHG